MMLRLQDKRLWLGGGAVVAVVILAVSWFLAISPQLSSAKSLRNDADSARAQNAVLTAKVAKLKQQNDKVKQLQSALRTSLAALPYDTGLPALTRQLASQAVTSRVALSSISIGTPVAVAAASAPTTTTTTSGTTAGSTTGSTTTGSTGAGTATTTMSISVTLLSKGTSAAQLAFLRAIQVDGPRRALVNSTTLSADSSKGTTSIDKASSMTTQLTVFTAPLTPAAQAQLLKLLSSK